MINEKGIISYIKLPKTCTENVLLISRKHLPILDLTFLCLFFRFTSTLKEKLIVLVFKDRRHRLISVISEQEHKGEDPITSSRVRVGASHEQVDVSGPLVLPHWLHRCVNYCALFHTPNITTAKNVRK
jgi:hypothetical protein